MSSSLNNLLTLLKDTLEVDLIPVAIGALQIYQKSPNILGLEAAEAYVLGNAPAALLAGATSVLQQEVSTLAAALAAAQAKLTAVTTPAVSKSP